MAIAFGSSVSLFDNGGTLTSFSTQNLTCTGSNIVLVVNIYKDNTTATVTDVTYNGVSFGAAAVSVAGVLATEYIYILVAPATGSALPIIVTTSAVITGNKQIGIVAQYYTGCAQTGQPDSFNSKATTLDTTTNFSVATTVVLPNCWLVGGAQSDLAGTIGSGSAGSGTIYRGAIAGNLWGADSNGIVGTGSQSLNFGKASTADDCTGCVISLAPFVASASSSNLLLMGVG